MIYALLARVPPVTTYRPSGDIMTMCGLTLLPRKTRPTILFVLMSMKARSFESRLTIMTTDVGSVILTSCCASVAVPARTITMTIASFTRDLVCIAFLLNGLKRGLQTNSGNQIAHGLLAGSLF